MKNLIEKVKTDISFMEQNDKILESRVNEANNTIRVIMEERVALRGSWEYAKEMLESLVKEEEIQLEKNDLSHGQNVSDFPDVTKTEETQDKINILDTQDKNKPKKHHK